MESSTNQLVNYFNQFIKLNEEEIEVITSIFREKKIKRRQYILQQEDVCKYNTFIVSGCFKVFFIDKKGKEHNLQLAIENGWVGDIDSFHHALPSKLNIEAVENSIILQVNKTDLWNLFITQPKFNHIFRVLAENEMVSLQKRILANISSTAEERYIEFIENNPALLNRISNVQIASYLGITPEFLSNIRKKIVQS